jgi:polysaccharide export outer membrane protein
MLMKSVVKMLATPWVGAGVLALFLVFTGCINPSPRTQPTANAPTDDSSDLIRERDVVTIVFGGVTDPPPMHEERIKEDGLIVLPLLPRPIKAAGLTRRELEQAIRNAYVPAFYHRLNVIVTTEFRVFYVRGEVNGPGTHPYRGGMTVLRAIAAAGDFTDFAKRSNVEITRVNGEKIRVNCEKAQGDSTLDIPIFADDRIYVPRRLF